MLGLSTRNYGPGTPPIHASIRVRLGTFGFGGPIALGARMEKGLVEERSWISRQDYGLGLAFSQLSPRPRAARLAMYFGWGFAARFHIVIFGCLGVKNHLIKFW